VGAPKKRPAVAFRHIPIARSTRDIMGVPGTFGALRPRMSKLALLLTISLPLTAFAGDAMKMHSNLKGHPNLVRAEKDLSAAAAAISKSQSANECVFGVEGGHGKEAKEAIEAAQHQVFESAEWVNDHGKDCIAIKGKKGGKVERAKAHGALKGHGNLVAAENDLIGAFEAISLSQEANECVFGAEGGHGQKAKELIETAYKQVYDAAEWANTHGTDCMKKK
jgi:hypothetical protein